ncbi:GAF domain-containing protein [Permianibacter aggregans]|uniref:Pyridoxamine 5'-phosphate oxidase n=1 Tax=Permianibacter aggregans TaxID=1510150 RepID=A0A4R6U9W6_9GAMM|nr:GAF domain-containing protein [Permianibacter aggregans]QGX40699.1 GAF domain-containing protein [Permianibacter aggregans]TDQ43398.1 pyridoxamine 5'-phosphate oxidase [Permianibacter aggregans]
MIYTPTLESIRLCLEGIIPSALATSDHQGMPNVTYVSQAMYVDCQHIALTFQFFNKTRENILANPIATLLTMDPVTAARYRLVLQYLRTETSGPQFEKMRAKLAGIASYEGMVGVFKLRGADIYRVLSIEHLPGRELMAMPNNPALLPALRRTVDSLGRYHSLENLVDTMLDSLDRHFNIRNSMLLMADPTAQKLYTLASRGYDRSGIGSEIPFGVGVIGVAAKERVPIRIMYFAAEYAYTKAVREQLIDDGRADKLEDRIPLPGLSEPGSQLAVPILANGHLQAVLYVESDQACRFNYDDEDALVAICAQVGEAMQSLQSQPPAEVCHSPGLCPTPQGTAIRVKYFLTDHSVFLDEEYLIKGVAGAILWRLLNQFKHEGRIEFTTRELRLDNAIPLPDVSDNLDARLLLLSRRLKERSDYLFIEKAGRGRIKLVMHRPVELQVGA